MTLQTSPFSPAGPAGMARTFRECATSLLWAIATFLAIQNCVIQSFWIPTGSMFDAMVIGDHILVSKCIVGIKVPLTNI